MLPRPRHTGGLRRPLRGPTHTGVPPAQETPPDRQAHRAVRPSMSESPTRLSPTDGNPEYSPTINNSPIWWRGCTRSAVVNLSPRGRPYVLGLFRSVALVALSVRLVPGKVFGESRSRVSTSCGSLLWAN